MFLRRNRREVNGESYEYWTLVESYRTERGPRQRVVASLGKLAGLDQEERHGWEEIEWLLEGQRPPRQLKLGTDEQTLGMSGPLWAEVDLSGVRVERVRDFGEVYLALSLWRRLGLDELLAGLIEPGRETIEWEQVACLLTLARFCAQKSELEVAERWYADSALEDLLGVPWQRVNDARLYRGLDVLHAHKEALCAHLMERYRSWFGVRFEFLLYDVTSTFFEGQAMRNNKAARGYSRDKRPDCKQVCIGLVVTPEGLPLAYEVFAGNRADVTTVEEIVEAMEKKYGVAQRIWILDRGMVSEENIEFLRAKGARYIVGTPKSQLRQFEKQLLDSEHWSQVVPGVEVKMVTHPDGAGIEQFVLCRSKSRREKEAAMLRQKFERLLDKLEAIDRSLRKGPSRDAGVIERRIGRWLGRYTGAETMVEVTAMRGDVLPAWRSAQGGPPGLGFDGSRRLPAAHQLPAERSVRLLAMVYPAPASRGRLSHGQERSVVTAGLSPENPEGRSPHPGLFFGTCTVANPGDVDARQRPGHLRPPTSQRSRHSAQHGRDPAGQRPRRSPPARRR